MADEVTARVIAVIAKSQRIGPETFTRESTFVDLNIDSLDGLQLVFALEEEFGVDIPDEAAKQFKSVGEVVQGLEMVLAKKAAGS
ncbi:MAG TPA: phosphopantetheine-binding protein [Paludibaculum sp.]|jgi:acyl carrier protein